MKSVINQFKLFIIPSILLVIFGIIGLGFIQTGDLVLYFNSERTDIIKQAFAIITQLGEEPMYVIFLIVALLMAFRFAVMIPLIGLFATIVSFSLKSFFKHPRPKIFFKDMIDSGSINLMEDIHTLGGYTSFPSGHTLSAFFLFGFAAYMFSSNRNYGKILQLLCLVLAALVGFSRIYLFQHFLKDVTLGAFLGTLLAIILAFICEKYNDGSGKWYERNLMNFRGKVEGSQRA